MPELEVTEKFENEEGTVQFVSERSYESAELSTGTELRKEQEDCEDSKDPRLKEFYELVGGRWDDNHLVVRTYIEDLEKRNDPKARMLLAKALKDGAPYTQSLACSALSRMGNDAIEILVKNLIRGDGSVHPDVFRSLRFIGKKGFGKFLEILEGKISLHLHSKQKIVLVRLLGDYAYSKVSAFLCKMLASMDRGLRQAASEALRKHGRVAEKSLLETLRLKDASHASRKACIYLLGRMRSQRAFPTLLNIFSRENNPYLVTLEAWALGEIGASGAIEEILFMLQSGRHTWMVERELIQTLGKIGSPEAIPTLVPLLERRELREAVIEALGKIGSPQALETLRPYMQSTVKYLRCLTVTALSRMGDRQALRLMLEGLEDEDLMVRRHTEKALESIYSEHEVEEIFQRWEEEKQKHAKPSPWQRLLAVKPEEPAEIFDEDFDEEGIYEKPVELKRPSWMERLRERALEQWERVSGKGPDQNTFQDFYPSSTSPFRPNRNNPW